MSNNKIFFIYLIQCEIMIRLSEGVVLKVILSQVLSTSAHTYLKRNHATSSLLKLHYITMFARYMYV